MSEIEHLHTVLRGALRDVSVADLRATLHGLEPLLEQAPKGRTQLTLRRLRFRGEKSGDFRFHPGVNVLRAGNDKGKSSILKLIHFCLTGKNELKKDVDAWIEEVDLIFELDGVPHALAVDKRKRPKGRLVRLEAGQILDADDPTPAFDPLQGAEVLLEFRNAKQMQGELETFFNATFGLRPLMGTQKASRKDSDALLDSLTSYRAYFRGLYINQDLGYTTLLTDGIPYGNLFMKVAGMLLGVRGIDAFFAVEARRAHLENQLAKEERYHRRLEESFEMPDLASLDDEIDKLERYIDELKVERTALFVRATSNDLDQRLSECTEKLVAFDDVRQQTASHLHSSEHDLRITEAHAQDLEAALASHQALAAIQPESCPVCETRIAERQRQQPTEAGRCVLCHEDMPGIDNEAMTAVLERRVAEARAALTTQRQRIDVRRADLDELEFRAGQSAQLKSHLQAQLRSAHQGTAELDREIEIETRYLGRLEARRENATQRVSAGDKDSSIADLLKHKQTLDAVLRHLRTQYAEANERMKRDFAHRVQEYCTTIGFPGLEDIHFDAQLKPRLQQNGKTYFFEELSPGEKVRFVLAFYLALAITTAEDLEHGTHPGLLLIDSPGKEEMVSQDFQAVVHLLSLVEEKHAASIQVLVATTLPAIRAATPPTKQVFIANDDEPMFA